MAKSLSNEEKAIFADAFYLGFMVAFDGWNGETFSLSQRRPEDSDILVAHMLERRKKYEIEKAEKAKLFPITDNGDGEFLCTGV